MERPNVLVLGAGPIGIETAAALQQFDMDVLVADAGPIGATIARQFPPLTRFFSSPDRLEIAGISLDDPGQEKTTREQYLAYLRGVVATLQLRILTYHHVERIDRAIDCFHIQMRTRSGGTTCIECKKLVLATGGTSHARILGIPGEHLPHVRHDLGEPHQYYGRRVLIIGGRNSACESALRCWRAGADVHLSYRGETLHERVKYWIRPELSALIDEGHVHGHFRSTLTEITESVARLQNMTSGTAFDLEIDDVLLQIGYEHDPSLMNAVGICCDGTSGIPKHDPQTMQTDVPGVYVAGTATAGTQDRFRIFIENCHIHAARIAASITGRPPPEDATLRTLEEN